MSILLHLSRALRFPLIVLLIILLSGSVAQEKKLAVYSVQGTVAFPLVERNGIEYVSVGDVLNRFGVLTLKQSGDKTRLHFTPRSGSGIEAEFTENKIPAKIAGRKIDLAFPFATSADHALIPTASIAQLLTIFLNAPVNFHQGSRRLFIESVSTSFTYDLQKTAPPRLVLHFTSAVNPSIATEPGRLRMNFTREPLVANASTSSLTDNTFSSISYNEANGAAEISVLANAPLLATFGDGGKSITITAQPNTPPPSASTSVPQPAAPTNATGSIPPPTTLLPPRYVVVIDPAHGGEDRGAVLTPALSEKDVVLAFARRLRTALENQGITAVLLRDSDSTLSADQRASAVNSSHAAIVISVHATSSSSGVHLYTSLLDATPRTSFLPWETAQAVFLGQSQSAASAIAKQMTARKIANSSLTASLRPLNNFARPAVAIELAPTDRKADALILLSYQQPIAAAVAAGVSEIRWGQESSR